MRSKRKRMMDNHLQTSPLRTNNTIHIKTSNINRKVTSSLRPKSPCQAFCRGIAVCSSPTTIAAATLLKCLSSTVSPHPHSNTTTILNSTKKVPINSNRSNRTTRMLLLIMKNNLKQKKRSLLKEQNRRMRHSD